MRSALRRCRLDEMALAADRLDATAEACRPSSESFVNPAKRLAIDIAGSLPVVWGAGGLCRVAAKRFARQLHANAKYPALDGGLQEAAHGTRRVVRRTRSRRRHLRMCFAIRSTTSRRGRCRCASC